MRYTTIIDIREDRALYRNCTTRLVYLHMCLTCGYHDADRGRVLQSIRQLAAECNVSVSAIRNSLSVLEKHGLCKRNKKGTLFVRTYIEEQPITKRKRARTTQESEQQREREAENERREREIDAAKQNAVPAPEALLKKFGIKRHE